MLQVAGEQNMNAFQLGKLELPPQTPVTGGDVPLGSTPVAPRSSTVANYEVHATDEIEKAVENIDVTGYRLLIVMPKMKETSDGGIYIDPNLLEKEKLAASIAYVAKAGPDSYKDTKKFPSGPWCKEGDWIVLKSYSGNRIKSTVNGIELRIINDDNVEAVIKDPSKYTRI